MKFRMYVAPQEFFSDGGNQWWRSIMHNFIDVTVGETFDEIDHPLRHASITSVTATAASHTAIMADGRATPLSPLVDSKADLVVWLDRNVASLPSNIRTAMVTKLEGLGINTAWIGPKNTLRELIRYLLRTFAWAQRVDGEGKRELVGKTLMANLDSTFNELQPSERSAVLAWLSAQGLPVEWIRPQTKIRAIVHSTVNGLGFGKFKFDKGDF